MRNDFWKAFFHRPLIPAALGATAVVVVALLLTTGLPGHPRGTVKRDEPVFDKLALPEGIVQSDFEIVPTKVDTFGVAADTRFVLKSKATLALAQVKDSLAMSPAVSFTVTSKSDREFEIRPSKALAEGVVYQIALGTTVQQGTAEEKRSFRWAFQTKSDLRIEGMLPRNKATGVPIDTGIEATFNTTKVGDMEKYWEISPATAGRFERHGRVIAFVAKDRLKPGTLYTVTIKKGLPVDGSSVTLPNDVVTRFETAAEQAQGNVFYGSMSAAFTAVQPGEAPVIDVGGPDLGQPTATVYKFKDAQDLIDRFATVDSLPIWSYYARQNATISSDGLKKVGEYTLKAESTVLRFASGFDAGYYLINLQAGMTSLQTPLVVSELGTSLTLTQKDSLLWLYDLKAKQPLTSAAVVSSLDQAKVLSDGTGVARVQTPAALLDTDPAKNRAYYVVTAADGRQTLVPAVPTQVGMFGRGRMFNLGGPADNRGFWSYLWTDRTLYRPTDSVNVFGIFKDRVKESPLDLTLEVWTWNLVDANGDYLPLVRESVKTDDYATFSQTLKLNQMKPGFYTLSVKNGDTSLDSISFEVRTFTTPAYQIIATPDKAAGFVGDKVTYAIRTEFFDGTPAPSVTVAYGTYSGQEGSGRLTTDGQGQATYSTTLVLSNPSTGYGDWQYLNFFPAESAEGDIEADTQVFVNPSAVSFWPQATSENDTVTLDLTLRSVNPNRTLSDWWSAAWNENEDDAPVPNWPMEGKVFEQVTTKKKIGEHYDAIEKKVIDDYQYDTQDEERTTFAGQTDANGTFTKTFTLTGESYRIAVTTKDSASRSITRSAYVYRSGLGFNGQTVPQLAVRDVNAPAQSNNAPARQKKYRPGETTTLQFLQDGQPIAAGTFLYVQLQNGLLDFAVTDSSTYPFTFTDRHIPNVFVTGIWFDGTNFQAVSYEWAELQFDEQSRKLNVTVTPDRSSYAPGDTAKLAVSVTDATGSPVAAAVNLSAIDQALATIQDDNTKPSPLATLYTPLSDGLAQQYVSTAPLALERGAEGGGGGDGPRKQFEDAPLFTHVVTGKDGKATVPFKLPDNITSWRIISQAVTKDLFAGDTVTMIPVTKEVFGVLTLAPEYVQADQPIVVARAYGSALKSGQTVQFTLELPGLGEPLRQTGEAFVQQRFTLPALKLGEQEIRLTVTAGEKKDIVVRTTNVMASRLTRTTGTFFEAKPDLTVPGSDRERTLLVVSDTGRGRILTTFQGLQWGYGKRLDRHLAARIAQDALAELHVVTSVPDSGFQPADYQQDDGGISLTTYSDSDLPLTALAAARADLFDRTMLRKFLVDKLQAKDASAEQVGQALLGLANLGESVLLDLNSYFEQDGITDEDRLTAALAYLALGDSSHAAALAVDLLTKYGEQQDPYIRLKLGATDDAKILNTARFSIIAEGLKLPVRLGLAKYLEVNFPKVSVTNLERALASQAAIPLLDDAPVTLHYVVNGKTETVELKDGATKTVSLTSDELKTFRVATVDGPAGITVLSTVPLNLETEPRDTRLSLDKRYSILGGAKRPIQEGDIVRVELAPRVGTGVIDSVFTVIDQLPSGLVLETQPWKRGGATFDFGYGWPIEAAGQRVTFVTNGQRTFFYYARVLTPGVFSAEPAVLQGQNSRDLVTYSGGQSIEIR